MKKIFYKGVSFFLAMIFVSFVGCKKNAEIITPQHQCNYTEQVTGEDYLASSATCQNAAKYYYSCTCGKVGDKTFRVGMPIGHEYTEEVVAEKYLQTPATCKEKAVYIKSCKYCGKKGSSKESFTYGEIGVCDERAEVVSAEYLKSEATFTESAIYYKSCSGCGKKGDGTFSYGLPLRSDYTDEEKASYMPTSLTVTLYDAENSIYGFTYNTLAEPLRPVIQIEKGNALTDNCQEYPARVMQASSYDETNKSFTYYIVKAEIELDDLSAYAYRAYDKYVGVGTETVVLKTKNTKASTFTFAHVADSQNYPAEFGNVLKSTVETMNFLVHTGDMVESSKHEQEWKAMLDGNFGYLSKIPVMAISGNHETTYKNGSNETFKHFNNKIPTQESTTKGYFYSFVYGNAKFIMLNTNDLTANKLKDEQYNWLVNELKNNTATWTIVAMHNPIYSVGKYGAASSSNQICLALRSQLQSLFVQYGVDIVLQGHDHTVTRTYPINANGVPQTEIFEQVDGVNYTVNPKGVLYLMNGTSGGQTRAPYAIDESLYKYAQSSTNSMWAEFAVNGNTMIVTVKAYNGTEIKEVQKWGIKKTA